MMILSMEMIKDMEEKMKNAIILLEEITRKRLENREISKQNYGLLLDAHLSAMACIGTLLLNNSMKPGKTSDSISSRLALIASFVQGIDLCETSISEGLYAQAANMLKQELETIAAIEEVISGTRKDGKTPNVKFVKWDMGKIYGELNKVAHVSDKKALHPLYQIKPIGNAQPVSMVPIYNKSVSRELYSIHVCFLIQIGKHLIDLNNELYEEYDSSTEYFMLISAMKRLEDEGLLSGDTLQLQ